MQDGGSPDTSLGSPAGDSAPGSPDDGVPFVPLPWENNTTDGMYPGSGRVPVPWPARSWSGSGSGSSSSSSEASFGGLLSLILVHALVVICVAW